MNSVNKACILIAIMEVADSIEGCPVIVITGYANQARLVVSSVVGSSFFVFADRSVAVKETLLERP